MNAVISAPTYPTPTGRSVPTRALIDRLREELVALESASSADGPAARRVRPIRPVGVDVAREMAFLRRVAAGLADVEGPCFPYDRAAAGSVLLVRDLRSGRDRFRKLMPGPIDPRDAAQLHVDSIEGRALLDRAVGDTVAVGGAGGDGTLLIRLMTTLPQRLGLHPR